MAIPRIPEYQAGTWDIDPVHSDVSFTVLHHGLTRYRRNFEKFDGQIITAPDPLRSSVTATVDITSFDTGLEKFNQHLLADGFFDAANHPTARFRSTGLRAYREQFALDGELTLRGVTRPVIFDLQLHGFGEGINGDSKVAFSAETTIRRDDFGIVFDATLPNGRLVVGNDVRISLEIEAVRR